MAGSINLANVAIGFDSSQLTKGVDLSGAELRKLNGIIKESISPVDKYSEEMIILDKAFQKGALTAERFAAASDQLAKKYGIETYAMIEARQAAEKLEQQQKEQLATQKRLDDELALAAKLHNQARTAEERHADTIKELDSHLKKNIIDQQTYNRLVEQSIRNNGLLVKAIEPAKVKTFSNAWTELNSAIAIAERVFHQVSRAANLVFDSMDRIDHINDQAHKLGMSFADLNTIQLALGESAGVSADDISKALQKLSIGITEALQTQKGAAFEALSLLKIDPAQLSGKKSIDQLTEIIAAMENVKSQGDRLKLTFDLFGKSGAALVAGFDEGAGQMLKMKNFAEEFGLNMSGPVVEGINNANDAMERLRKVTGSTIDQFTGGMAPAIEAIADQLTNAQKGKGVGEVGETTGRWMASILGGAQDIGEFLNYNPFTATAEEGKKAFEFDRWNRLQIEIDVAKQRAIESDEARTKQREEGQERLKIEADAEKVRADSERKAKEELLSLEDDYKRGWADYEDREKKRLLKEEYAAKIMQANNEHQMRLGKLKDSGAVTENSAPTLRAGSVEAYKFMIAQKDKTSEAVERHIKVTEDSNRILDEQLKAIQSQPKFSRVR